MLQHSFRLRSGIEDLGLPDSWCRLPCSRKSPSDRPGKPAGSFFKSDSPGLATRSAARIAPGNAETGRFSRHPGFAPLGPGGT